MTIAGRSRRVVAFVTALLLLLCQTAVAAHACDHPVGAAYAAEAQPPCHEAAGDDDAVPHGSHATSACDAAKAVGDMVKIPLLAITELPALAIDFVATPAAGALVTARAPETKPHPPPPRVLYARLLI